MERFGCHAKLASLERPHEVGYIVDTHRKLPLILNSLVGPSGSYCLYYRSKYSSVHQAPRLMVILTDLEVADNPLGTRLRKVQVQKLHKGARAFQIDIYLSLIR